MEQKIELKQILKKTNQSLVIIYTGDGKGKTTAALGLALRAIKAGFKVLMIQFLKSSQASGEAEIPKKILPQLEVKTFGRGFVTTPNKQELKDHRAETRKGLEYARTGIESKKYDIIILDEINVVLGLELAGQKDVVRLINLARQSSHSEIHLVLTGRNCPHGLYKFADLVTEMKEIKHPFKDGRLAVLGIDY